MWLPWREATERALYGEAGFYRRTRPERHFRTSVGVSAQYAAALATLLVEVDARLGHPARLDVVDMGAGSGRLLEDLAERCPDRVRLTAVELAARPKELPAEIAWTPEPPDVITGLVIANEWLDNVPVDVVEQTVEGPRLVLVDPESGAERLGDLPDADDLAWLELWWPLDAPGDRAEIGGSRDQAWAGLVRRLANGVAIAADYDHTLKDRPPAGTLTGYRDGYQVIPMPDGSCDITAHVALDACAAAVTAAETVLTTQRDALRALGVDGTRPPIELARTDPPRYLRELGRAGEQGELIDRSGLGGFGWLVQSVGGHYLPESLTATIGR